MPVDDLRLENTTPLKPIAPKALPEDTSDVDNKNEDIMPLTSPGDQPVQFVPGHPGNGDAKLEIGEAGGPAFVGLGKEELLKYANDPFWVKLRWVLFFLFWALWLAMLTGAIVIIVMAPKCQKRSPPEALVELQLNNIVRSDDGKLLVKGQDLDVQVNFLKDLGVTAVVLPDILKRDERRFIEDYKMVDSSVGTMKDFEDAVKKLKSIGIKAILRFVPNHSSVKHPLFNDTSNGKYVRRPAEDVRNSLWKVVVDPNQMAWAEEPNNNGTKYLQLFGVGSADFNFSNSEVVADFKEIISFWKDKGIEAFYIPDASYLVEDMSRLSDITAIRNQPQNLEVLKTILNRLPHQSSSIVEVDGLSPKDARMYLEEGLVPFDKKYDISSTSRIPVKNVMKTIYEDKYPVLRLSGSLGQMNGLDQDDANIVRFLAYTSNATVVINYGSLFGGEENATNATFGFVKDLAAIQQSLVDSENHHTIRDGKNRGFIPTDEDIFTFVRAEKYIGIVNFGDTPANETVSVDFGELVANMSNPNLEAEILIATPNAQEALGTIPGKENPKIKKVVKLPGKSGVLLKIL